MNKICDHNNHIKGGHSSGEPAEKPEFWFPPNWLDQGQAAFAWWSGYHPHNDNNDHDDNGDRNEHDDDRILKGQVTCFDQITVIRPVEENDNYHDYHDDDDDENGDNDSNWW